MPKAAKFHLVDASGNPLDERFHQVTRKLEGHFRNVLQSVGDEAVICNCVEEAARRVHAHEQKSGHVKDLGSFFLRVFSNLVKSLLRGPHYTRLESSFTAEELEKQAGPAQNGCAEATERHILIDEALRGLSEKKRMMLMLDAIGYSAKDIGRRLQISESDVYTTIHRAREEARKVMMNSGLGRSK